MAAKSKGSENGRRRRLIRRLIRRGIGVVILLVVLVVLFIVWEQTDHAPTVQMAPEQPTPTVNTIVVQAESVPLVPRYLGQVEASQVVEIRARVDGFLEERAFEEGALVERGQLLFQIDPRTFQAEREIARSRLASAEARLTQAEQQVRRYEQLVTTGAATATELEQWQTDASVAAADAQLARAQIAQAELDVSYTTIQSPIRGVIGESLQDVGTYVSAGTENLLAVVSQLDPIYVRLSVSEVETLRFQSGVAQGQILIPEDEEFEIAVTLSTGQEYPYRGEIGFVDVQVDPFTGTRVVRATVPNPDQILVPGQAVHATIHGATRTDALLVPQEAVMQTPTGSFVYVVSDDHTVEQRPVLLGEWHEDRWIVEDGLRPGDRIVTDQLMRLRPGMEVYLAEQTSVSSTESPSEPEPEQAPRS